MEKEFKNIKRSACILSSAEKNFIETHGNGTFVDEKALRHSLKENFESDLVALSYQYQERWRALNKQKSAIELEMAALVRCKIFVDDEIGNRIEAYSEKRTPDFVYSYSPCKNVPRRNWLTVGKRNKIAEAKMKSKNLLGISSDGVAHYLYDPETYDPIVIE